jgi:chorismate dehydratase
LPQIAHFKAMIYMYSKRLKNKTLNFSRRSVKHKTSRAFEQAISVDLNPSDVSAAHRESHRFKSLCYTEGASGRLENDVSSLRISIVQYLNTAPLVRGFTHGPLRGKYQLSFTVPSQCAEALRSGLADIAIIPAIEYQRIPNLTILPNLAVASKKSVRSLLLVSKKPIREVTRIALDRTSRSTQALVRILCAMRWHIAPEFFEAEPELPSMLDRADAALLIGDRALRLAIASSAKAKRDPSGEYLAPGSVAGLTEVPGLFLFDIVEKWRAMTSLPAVLAIWAARKEAVTPEVVRDFQESLEFGLAHLDAIVSEASAELGFPSSDLRRYFTENIDYRLDEENLSGLERFYALAEQLRLIPKVDAIAVAPEPDEPTHFTGLAVGKKRGTVASD